ncbi:uncharacterized protein LOC125241588 isoform X2 [Leguminivora glycinivorella]|uniref:uncharacterized protein LOC125241588 isoform X2 n=1 Tax=Leguminivora glycinivorella TaxID=1035111 RepID=UPI00200F1953|nr:uncharacterized protein LOC125241588 isoform X2 [Leguminivora glycinivorella]
MAKIKLLAPLLMILFTNNYQVFGCDNVEEQHDIQHYLKYHLEEDIGKLNDLKSDEKSKDAILFLMVALNSIKNYTNSLKEENVKNNDIKLENDAFKKSDNKESDSKNIFKKYNKKKSPKIKLLKKILKPKKDDSIAKHQVLGNKKKPIIFDTLLKDRHVQPKPHAQKWSFLSPLLWLGSNLKCTMKKCLEKKKNDLKLEKVMFKTNQDDFITKHAVKGKSSIFDLLSKDGHDQSGPKQDSIKQAPIWNFSDLFLGLGSNMNCYGKKCQEHKTNDLKLEKEMSKPKKPNGMAKHKAKIHKGKPTIFDTLLKDKHGLSEQQQDSKKQDQQWDLSNLFLGLWSNLKCTTKKCKKNKNNDLKLEKEMVKTDSKGDIDLIIKLKGTEDDKQLNSGPLTNNKDEQSAQKKVPSNQQGNKWTSNFLKDIGYFMDTNKMTKDTSTHKPFHSLEYNKKEISNKSDNKPSFLTLFLSLILGLETDEKKSTKQDLEVRNIGDLNDKVQHTEEIKELSPSMFNKKTEMKDRSDLDNEDGIYEMANLITTLYYYYLTDIGGKEEISRTKQTKRPIKQRNKKPKDVKEKSKLLKLNENKEDRNKHSSECKNGETSRNACDVCECVDGIWKCKMEGDCERLKLSQKHIKSLKGPSKKLYTKLQMIASGCEVGDKVYANNNKVCPCICVLPNLMECDVCPAVKQILLPKTAKRRPVTKSLLDFQINDYYDD